MRQDVAGAEGAGQAARHRPELRGVAAPLTPAGEEPVRGQEPSSLQLALRQSHVRRSQHKAATKRLRECNLLFKMFKLLYSNGF